MSLASLAAPGNSLDPARFEESLRRGATLTEALRTTGLFSDRLLAGVSSGEATGTTAEVLDRLAGDVSGGRGFARRVDAGDYDLLSCDADDMATATVIVLTFAGATLSGRLRLEAVGEGWAARLG